MTDKASLETGLSLPALQDADTILIQANPLLTAVTGLAALRSVRTLEISDNPRLVDVELPALQQVHFLKIRGNYLLDDAPLAPLRALDVQSVRIVSNFPGPSLLSPCPWSNDLNCDELGGDCAPGTDALDCSPPPMPSP